MQDTVNNSGQLQHCVRDAEIGQETEAEVGSRVLVNSVEKVRSSSGGSGELLKDFKQSNGRHVCNWEYYSETFILEEGIGLGKMSTSFSEELQISMLLQ